MSAPTLLSSYDRDEWVALVLDDIDGRHPGGALDGSDVGAVLDAFATFPRVERPDQGGLPRVSDEITDEASGWREVLDDGAAADLPEWVRQSIDSLESAAAEASTALSGDFLQHLDSRADNVLLDQAGRAWIIDWPWAGVGARWVDGLMYLFDCRVRGESVDTEGVLRSHPLFDGVPESSVDAVLSAMSGGFFAKSRRPAPPNMPTLRAFQKTEALAGIDWLRERWQAKG
ncbi:hypothetical protein GCM10025867_35980 [Frondihabitans sucicola]|uniref:Aminoglycoside phosphotransferase domain-containing protein n=1 Tax=Frondihabitans sucicola TaxID=1268041 RepID=A0ABN6Y1Y6_9MICO|nr:phosphotransferase [Frondihabitans sucicola]BDZ51357.1 hypothetical protein GCM10025867_35980 [Frondihabitans sucicola]